MILLNKALKYANDVVNDIELTTSEVKTQCKWFLEDLEKQKQEEFEFYFDEEKLKIIEGVLSLMNFATGINVVGKPIVEGIENFQAYFIANIFGWRVKVDNLKFRYKDVTLFIPRKNSKTFLCALIIILLMLTEEYYSEFYSICLDRELAGETKKAISQILDSSPHLSKRFKVPTTLSGKVICNVTKSFYQPRTAEANRNNAIRPSAFVADEIGAFKDYKNINAMKSGQLSVKNPLVFKLTTAYAEDRSIMLDELDYIKKVYAGLVTDSRMFALLYYAPKEHLWDDTGLYMSNPLRVSENYDEIKESRRKAIEKPKEQEEFLTKHMNHFVPTNSGEAFVDINDVRKGKLEHIDWTGRDVWVGLDLAMTNDNCSYSMVTIENDEIYADSYAYIPADRIVEKSRNERINYNDFIDEGKCIKCGDLVVDYKVIEDAILYIEEKHNVRVRGIGYDRYNCLSTAQKLEAEGYICVEVKQHSSVLHPATKFLEERILNGQFHYEHNTLLEINFQNARCVYDTNLNKYVNKKKSNGKIDMVVSIINGIFLLLQDEVFNNHGDTFYVPNI